MLPLLVFIGLQCSDLATTLWFLHVGIKEANPLIVALLRSDAPPAAALMLLKGLGCLLAVLAWKRGSIGLLRRLNVLFAGCVAWTLLAIAMH